MWVRIARIRKCVGESFFGQAGRVLTMNWTDMTAHRCIGCVSVGQRPSSRRRTWNLSTVGVQSSGDGNDVSTRDTLRTRKRVMPNRNCHLEREQIDRNPISLRRSQIRQVDKSERAGKEALGGENIVL